MAKTYYASSTCSPPPPPPPSLSGYRKILINYATENMTHAQKINARTGLRWGKFDEVICYGPQDIDAGFYEKNRSILTKKRGAGYWLWKPYFILKTLRRMKDGDYLFYTDAGSFFIAPVDPLIHATAKMDHEIAVSVNRGTIKERIKRDALILTGMDKPTYLHESIVEGGIILLKKSNKTVNLMKEWLELCCDRRLVTDDENVMGKPNHPEFITHRHDQSVFTLLYIKHGFMNCSYFRVDQHPNMKHLARNMDCFIPIIVTRRRNTNRISAIVYKLLWANALLIRLIMHIPRIKQREDNPHMDRKLEQNRNIKKWIACSSRITYRCDRFYEATAVTVKSIMEKLRLF